MPEYYKIKIKGHIEPRWSDWFDGLQLTHLEGNETLLPDHVALHGLFNRIRDLNLLNALADLSIHSSFSFCRVTQVIS